MKMKPTELENLEILRVILRERSPESHLFTRSWGELTVEERRVALSTIRAWAKEDATGGIMESDPWPVHLEARIFLTYGEEALVAWREVRDEAVFDQNGCDPREAVFTATAEATRLRVVAMPSGTRAGAQATPRAERNARADRKPRAAARRLLLRGGQRTVRTRQRRLATAAA